MKNTQGVFIPVNDMPNYDELIDTMTEENKVLESNMADTSVPEGRPEEPNKGGNGGRLETFRYNMEREVDFVWGFLFFDFPIIYVEGNNLHFQGEIHKESVNTIKQYLIEMRKHVQTTYNSIGIYDMSKMEINLYINSPGGCMASGFDLIDFIRNYNITINTIGTGRVASMAVLLLCAGAKRSVHENCHLLVHQFRTQIGGKRQDILDYLVHLEQIHKQMVAFMAGRTKLKKEEINEMLKNETWLTAEEARDMGFVDVII